jgi:2-dehydropantoate 2-reductase
MSATGPRGIGARVAVVGAGAVGCWYGAMLARAGVPVMMIGRPAHVEAMRARGLRLTSAAGDEVVAVQADTDAAAAAGAQVVLVCVKATDTESAGAALAPHLVPGACVLSLQNGVDNAERLEAALGAPVQPAVVYVASEMAGPGHVRHLGRGELVIPCAAPGGVALANEEVARLFVQAGVPVELSGNVAGALWLKLVLNCAYNALSAITDLPYGPLVTQPGIPETMRAAVLECLAVAQARGVALPGDVFEAVERIARTMPGQFSSTAQDVRRGKRSEIDHLNGFVVREGERLGIATPVNRTLHALVKAIDARLAASGGSGLQA